MLRTISPRNYLLTALTAALAASGCSCGDDPVPTPDKPTIVAFAASPAMVTSGQSTQISWKVTGAATLTIAAMPGGTLVEATDVLEGDRASSPITVDTAFTLTARAADGSSATRTINVTVGVAGEVMIEAFDATPMTVAPGGMATLSYRVTNATRVRISAMDGPVLLDSTTMMSGTVTVNPNVTTSYVLVADGSGGPKSLTRSVAVEGTPVIDSFAATPPSIELGESTTLAWTTRDAATITVRDSANAEIATGTTPSGMTMVSPMANETYTLTARSALGQEVTQTVMVTVNRAARIDRFVVTPNRVDYGDSAVLEWQVTRASGVDITARGAAVGSSTATTGRLTVTATRTTEYTLTARNPSGDAMGMVTLTVDAVTARVRSFTALPNPALIGGRTTLSWVTVGATAIEISIAGVIVGTSTAGVGSVVVPVDSSSTTYSLAAINPFGTTTAMLDVIGQVIPTVTTFTARPLTFAATSTVVAVSWATADATSTTLTANGRPVAGFGGGTDGTFTFTTTVTADLVLTALNAVGQGSRSARVLQLALEVDGGNDATTAQPLVGDGGGVGGTITMGDSDFYSFVVPEGGNVRAELSDGQGGCAFDNTLTLYAPDGTTVLGSDDDDGTGDCAAIDPLRDVFATNLAAGTYFVAVRGDAATGRYALLLTVAGPRCGNSILERRGLEECEDGNVVGGDGCSAMCSIEPIGVVNGPDATGTFTGAIALAGNAAFVRVVMAAPGYIGAETFVPVVGRCDTAGGSPSSDTTLALQDAQFTNLGTDDDDGLGACALISARFDAFTLVPAGSYWIRVGEAGNNGTITAFTVRVQTLRAGCGNGIIEGMETCDDGNVMGGDGCSAACGFEGTSEVEPNNTFGTATSLPGSGRYAGAITPIADVDFYAITLTAGQHLDVNMFVNSSNGCPVDPEGRLQLIAPNGTTVQATNTTGGADDNCGRIWPYTTVAARGMAAGTYFIRVNETGDNSVIVPYFLDVRVIAPGCGNTILETGETCDDGNTTMGDGCNATCRFEPVATVTLPNTGSATVSGSLVPSFARRVVQLDVTSPIVLRAETFVDAATRVCPAGSDMRLRLFAADGTTELGTDDDDGVGECALITPVDTFGRLAAGTYYLLVEEDGLDRALPNFALTIRGRAQDTCGNGAHEPGVGEQCDDGNLLSGDRCAANCTIEPVGVMVGPTAAMTFNGAITPAGDLDYYRLELSAPSIIIAETGAPTAGTCAAGVDTIVRLYNGTAGTELAVNDDINGASNRCSRIDGVATAAARVAAGTYFIRVEDFENNGTIDPYQVAIRVDAQNVCGNRLVEGTNNELCDDGNTTAGDGCSATCSLEPVATINLAAGGTGTYDGVINTIGVRDAIRVVVTGTLYLRAETFAPTAPTCATADTFIRLFSGNAELANDDQDGVNSCSLIARATDAGARLTAGTYFVTVEESGNNAAIPNYQLQLTATAADVCGDGIPEPAALEQCDDGNTTAGDGCGATCQVEVLATYSIPGPAVTFAEAITPATNVDNVRLDVTQPAYVRVETFAPSYAQCITADTFIRLTSVATNLVVGTDDQDGRNSCSLFNPNVDAFARLAVGSYYLSVEESGRNAVIPAYELRISSAPVDVCGNGFRELAEECDDGNVAPMDGCTAACALETALAEVEPNGTIATANPSGVTGPRIATMSGNVTPAGDLDFYAFTVPAGGRYTLRARTYSTAGNSLSTCNDAIDTRLLLQNPAGTVLEDNDDISGAANRCSFIDGLLPDTDPNARGMAAGTYYLRVSHFSSSSPAPAGPYFLQIQLVAE